eukprot:COSAG02_NODE_986_length_15452_cov_17.818602_7_plen_48_part_00
MLRELCDVEDWDAEINDEETREQYAEANALLSSGGDGFVRFIVSDYW